MRYHTLFRAMAVSVISSILVSCQRDTCQTALEPGATPEFSISYEENLVQKALFSLPDDCEGKCFWNIPLEETSFEEFRQFLIDVFPVTLEMYAQDSTLPLKGLYTSGLSIGSSSLSGFREGESGIGYIDVRVRASEAVNIYQLEAVSPAGIITYFDIPDNVYINVAPDKTVFSISFLYEEEAFLYVIWGPVQENKLCLGLGDIDAFTSYRFLDSALAIEYIDFQTPSLPSKPLTDYIQENLEDLPALAEQKSFCLTLK